MKNSSSVSQETTLKPLLFLLKAEALSNKTHAFRQDIAKDYRYVNGASLSYSNLDRAAMMPNITFIWAYHLATNPPVGHVEKWCFSKGNIPQNARNIQILGIICH